MAWDCIPEVFWSVTQRPSILDYVHFYDCVTLHDNRTVCWHVFYDCFTWACFYFTRVQFIPRIVCRKHDFFFFNVGAISSGFRLDESPFVPYDFMNSSTSPASPPGSIGDGWPRAKSPNGSSSVNWPPGMQCHHLLLAWLLLLCILPDPLVVTWWGSQKHTQKAGKDCAFTW